MTEEILFEDLLHTFIEEAEENLTTMEESLLALEHRPADEETINTVFRMVHSVKGGAACVGFELVAGFAHVAENLLDEIREGTRTATPEVITQLLQSVDVLRKLISPMGPIGPVGPMGSSLRVPTERVDRMVDLCGEIAIARGRQEWEDIDRLFFDLQELVMKTRMVPAGSVFAAFHRTVRDLAHERGKIARLTIEGSEVEIDHGVVDKLRDPITHMIRNAVDHGIEMPDVRGAKGKDPCGRITLSAAHEGGMIVIRVADDGGGIDRARILDRAGAESLSDAEMHALIFQPGFSTASEVNDLSGRGVGMDVVKRNIESLHGSIAIESRAGEGTTVTAKLPLTLAIIEGFGVSAGEEHFVLPLTLVTECVSTGAIAGVTSILNLRGEPVPVVRLRNLFDIDAPPPVRENVVIVECGDQRAGIAVDHLHGSSQVVVKPMSELFRALPGISGSAILGNGRVALILDVPALLTQLNAPQESIA